jgi:hypothetical protein
MNAIVRDELANLLEATAAQVVTALRRGANGRDWLDEILDSSGDVVRSDQAAYIWGASDDTIRRRTEAAELAGVPIGYLMAGSVWLFSLRRLLDAIELEDGRHARLAAQTRADKNAALRFQPHNSAALRL